MNICWDSRGGFGTFFRDGLRELGCGLVRDLWVLEYEF